MSATGEGRRRAVLAGAALAATLGLAPPRAANVVQGKVELSTVELERLLLAQSAELALERRLGDVAVVSASPFQDFAPSELPEAGRTVWVGARGSR